MSTFFMHSRRSLDVEVPHRDRRFAWWSNASAGLKRIMPWRSRRY